MSRYHLMQSLKRQLEFSNAKYITMDKKKNNQKPKKVDLSGGHYKSNNPAWRGYTLTVYTQKGKAHKFKLTDITGKQSEVYNPPTDFNPVIILNPKKL